MTGEPHSTYCISKIRKANLEKGKPKRRGLCEAFSHEDENI